MWRRLTFSIVVVLVSGSGALAQQPHEVYTCKGSCTTESGQNGHRLMECRFGRHSFVMTRANAYLSARRAAMPDRRFPPVIALEAPRPGASS
jgi:hypothetical protein